MAKTKLDISLEALEPLVDRLLMGSANVKEVAKTLSEWGYPSTLDQTEQLRLALSLLECHDDVLRSREARPKEPSRSGAKIKAPEKPISRSGEADYSP